MKSQTAKVLVTGHRGMVGSALVRRLQACGYVNLLTRTHDELDLADQRAVHGFLAEHRPDCCSAPIPAIFAIGT